MDCAGERLHTNIPHTSVISNAVGTIRNIKACNMNVIPLFRVFSHIAILEMKEYTLSPAINRSCKSTSLPRKMEFEIKSQQMFECLPCNACNSSLTDISEYDVEQFA